MTTINNTSADANLYSSDKILSFKNDSSKFIFKVSPEGILTIGEGATTREIAECIHAEWLKIVGATADVAADIPTLAPFAYCIVDGCDREYNTIDEFSGGRSNGVQLYTAAQVQAILNERLAAGAPASTGRHAVFKHVNDEVAASMREGLAFGAPAETPKPAAYIITPRTRDDKSIVMPHIAANYSDQSYEKIPLYRAAQPSPAPIAGDVEKDALDAQRYRVWRDAMLTDDQRLVTAMQDALPSDVGDSREPTADEWDAALDRAAMLANSSSGEAG